VTGTDPRTFYIQGDQGFRLYPENVPGLSSDLVVILRRLTSPQPEDRYGTALEVVTALKQLNID
jgi:serine/threonine-protein kinase